MLCVSVCQGNWIVGDYGWFLIKFQSYFVFFVYGFVFQKGFEVLLFNIVDLYLLMCKFLGIELKLNNGFLENVKMMFKEYVSKLIVKGKVIILELYVFIIFIVLSMIFYIYMISWV